MAAKSGKKTVTTAGTEEKLGTIQVNAGVMVKALIANTGTIYIGNAGDDTVASTTGLELLKQETVILDWVGNLGSIWIDASVNGEGVSWIVLNW